MMSQRIIAFVAFAAALFGPGSASVPAARPASLEGVAAYSLPKITPPGFGICRGILDWVPVSKTQAVAFAVNRKASAAANRDASSRDDSLHSFVLSKTGAASGTRAFASGLGQPRAAAGFWIEGGAPHGLLFVLFNNYDPAKDRQFARIAVAKFDAAGKRTSGWKTLFQFDPGRKAYFDDEALYAARGPRSIALVVSGHFYLYGQGPDHFSRAYFLEAQVTNGSLAGPVLPLTLPAAGEFVFARGSSPDWNGAAWLVPVSAALYSRAGDGDTVLENRALVYSVSPPSGVVQNEIAHDTSSKSLAYESLVLAPDPANAAGRLLFVRHRTPIPANRQRLDMYEYDYSLKRLGATGALVSARTLSLPKTAHKLVYSPAYTNMIEFDYWSRGVVRGEKLYLSNARTLLSRGGGSAERFEQQVNFYEVNLRTAAVEHRARAIQLWARLWMEEPILHAFPGGALVVVNAAYHTQDPYSTDNTFTRFAD